MYVCVGGGVKQKVCCRTGEKEYSEWSEVRKGGGMVNGSVVP